MVEDLLLEPIIVIFVFVVMMSLMMSLMMITLDEKWFEKIKEYNKGLKK